MKRGLGLAFVAFIIALLLIPSFAPVIDDDFEPMMLPVGGIKVIKVDINDCDICSVNYTGNYTSTIASSWVDSSQMKVFAELYWEDQEGRHPISNGPIVFYATYSDGFSELLSATPSLTDAEGRVEVDVSSSVGQSLEEGECANVKAVYCPTHLSSCDFELCLQAAGIDKSDAKSVVKTDPTSQSPLPSTTLPSSSSTIVCKPRNTGLPANLQSTLCLPLFIIGALLGGALFAAGRNPFMGFDIGTVKLKKHFTYTPKRIVIPTFNIAGQIEGFAKGAIKGIGKVVDEKGKGGKKLTGQYVKDIFKSKDTWKAALQGGLSGTYAAPFVGGKKSQVATGIRNFGTAIKNLAKGDFKAVGKQILGIGSKGEGKEDQTTQIPNQPLMGEKGILGILGGGGGGALSGLGAIFLGLFGIVRAIVVAMDPNVKKGEKTKTFFKALGSTIAEGLGLDLDKIKSDAKVVRNWAGATFGKVKSADTEGLDKIDPQTLANVIKLIELKQKIEDLKKKGDEKSLKEAEKLVGVLSEQTAKAFEGLDEKSKNLIKDFIEHSKNITDLKKEAAIGDFMKTEEGRKLLNDVFGDWVNNADAETIYKEFINKLNHEDQIQNKEAFSKLNEKINSEVIADSNNSLLGNYIEEIAETKGAEAAANKLAYIGLLDVEKDKEAAMNALKGQPDVSEFVQNMIHYEEEKLKKTLERSSIGKLIDEDKFIDALKNPSSTLVSGEVYGFINGTTKDNVALTSLLVSFGIIGDDQVQNLLEKEGENKKELAPLVESMMEINASKISLNLSKEFKEVLFGKGEGNNLDRLLEEVGAVADALYQQIDFRGIYDNLKHARPEKANELMNELNKQTYEYAKEKLGEQKANEFMKISNEEKGKTENYLLEKLGPEQTVKFMNEVNERKNDVLVKSFYESTKDTNEGQAAIISLENSNEEFKKFEKALKRNQPLDEDERRLNELRYLQKFISITNPPKSP